MKKVLMIIALLGIIGAIIFFTLITPKTANAEGLNVTVGGFMDFQSGYADQDLDTSGPNSRDFKFQNDTEIHFAVDGMVDNGLKYGAVIELNADVTADATNDGGNADKTYLWLESDTGRLELGSNSGAQDTLKVDASSIAVATGGIDGDWYQYVDTTAGNFIIRPDLPQAHALGVTEDATKITYYTPRILGTQFGVSYTPDNGNVGTAAGFTSDSNGNQQDVFGLAANWEGTVGSFSTTLSATGEFGTAELSSDDDLEAYAVGGSMGYNNVSFAGSYGTIQSNVGDANFWTAGSSYTTGPFGFSVTYLDSENGDDDFTNLSVGSDYQLAPGFVPYVEASFFELDSSTGADNEGTVVLAGATLTF